jgi:hypothetical protein
MMSSRAPATILLLAMSLGPGLMACGDKPEDSGPVEGDTDSDSDADTDSDTDTGPTDGDGDGVPAHEDCDDTDPSVGGPNAWYSDADQDNYGDPASIQHACEQPSGTVADGSDCDDTDPAVHPAAQEVCDGIDNDCDGAVDDGDDSLDPGTRLTWYQDADGDGWGLETSTLDACDLPAGYCGTSGDCDDGDAAVNPDAWDVIDGVDNDCDGTEDAIPLESAEIVLEGDASYEGAGAAIAGQRDFNGDGFTDLLISAPAADTTTTDVGQVYVLHGPITASMSLAGSDAIITGTEESGYLGFPIAALDDVHGDGNDDLLLSTYGWGEYSWPHESGDLFLFPGPVAGSLSQADARLVIQSDSLVDNRLGDAGDLDGDGLGDAIASSTDHGLVWVLSGAELAGSGTLQLDDLVAPIRRHSRGSGSGTLPMVWGTSTAMGWTTSRWARRHTTPTRPQARGRCTSSPVGPAGQRPRRVPWRRWSTHREIHRIWAWTWRGGATWTGTMCPTSWWASRTGARAPTTAGEPPPSPAAPRSLAW